jgi:hypothetical protein
MRAEFIILARGGRYVAPYLSRVSLTTDDPDWHRWARAEGTDPDSFDDWCNSVLNEMVNDLEEGGASAVVLSLEEYRNLPKH